MTNLYEARRRAREAEAAVLDADDEAALVDRLETAVRAAGEEERTERSFRLQILAELLAKVGDRRATQGLVRLLAEDEAAVRTVVVEGLERLLRSGRAAEVAWAVERVLEQGLPGPGASQLPAVLLQLLSEENPPPVDLLTQLLEHENPEVTAEAACALATLDVAGIKELLSSFLEDRRPLIAAAGEPQCVAELVRDLLDVMDLEERLPGRLPTA